MILFILAQTLVLTVKNIKKSEGDIRIFIWNNKDDFINEDKKPYKSICVPAKKGEVVVNINDFNSCEFAVFVHHDIYKKGAFERNFLGIPKDPYAFSRGVGKLKKPIYDEAVIKITPENLEKFLCEICL